MSRSVASCVLRDCVDSAKGKASAVELKKEEEEEVTVLKSSMNEWEGKKETQTHIHTGRSIGLMNLCSLLSQTGVDFFLAEVIAIWVASSFFSSIVAFSCHSGGATGGREKEGRQIQKRRERGEKELSLFFCRSNSKWVPARFRKVVFLLNQVLTDASLVKIDLDICTSSVLVGKRKGKWVKVFACMCVCLWVSRGEDAVCCTCCHLMKQPYQRTYTDWAYTYNCHASRVAFAVVADVLALHRICLSVCLPLA